MQGVSGEASKAQSWMFYFTFSSLPSLLVGGIDSMRWGVCDYLVHVSFGPVYGADLGSKSEKDTLSRWSLGHKGNLLMVSSWGPAPKRRRE